MTRVGQMELDYKSRTLWFILVSLLLHALVMLALSRDWASGAHSSAKNDSIPIEIVQLSKHDIEKLKSQIVETSLTNKADKAADNAYLGQQTQVVARQTKARTTAPFSEGHKGGSKGKAQPAPKLAMGSLGVKMNYKPMGNLGPGAIAASSDYLSNVHDGAQTLLNTKEYAYYSFYQRVRKQLEQYWEPGLRQRLKKMFERGRRLANEQEHSTKLTVVMSTDGTITKILVDGTSGVLDLDQAAVDAFNKAGPFPNPPHGLIEKDGTVRIEWEFILKT